MPLIHPEMETISPDPEVAIPDGLAGTWWVAHTRSRNEKILARELHQLEIFNYLPLKQKMTRSHRTGRKSYSTVPVFAGYIFLNATESQRYRALSTNRVANMLFVAAQEQLVTQLRNVHRVIATDAAFEQFDGIRVGQWVRVVDGPLEGVEGQVVQQLGKLRLAVNVDILGQSVLAEVSAPMLEAIDQPEPTISNEQRAAPSPSAASRNRNQLL
jgi:transcription antitermination factor NusG